MELLKDQVQPAPTPAHTRSIGDVKIWLERQYLLVDGEDPQQVIDRIITVPDHQLWKTWMETPECSPETTCRPFSQKQPDEFNQLRKSA